MTNKGKLNRSLTTAELENFHNYELQSKKWFQFIGRSEDLVLNLSQVEDSKEKLPVKAVFITQRQLNVSEGCLLMVTAWVTLLLGLNIRNTPILQFVWLATSAVSFGYLGWSCASISADKAVPNVILSSKSIQLLRTGEFLWDSVIDIRIVRYRVGPVYLLLLLNNGVVVEHQIKKINEVFGFNRDDENGQELLAEIGHYWGTILNEKR